jgi:hypothetical protein
VSAEDNMAVEAAMAARHSSRQKSKRSSNGKAGNAQSSNGRKGGLSAPVTEQKPGSTDE